VKANLSSEVGDVEFSLKPKLLLIAHTLVFWGLMHFYIFIVAKKRRFHSIKKIHQNLVDLNLQYIFANLVAFGVFVDQTKNLLLQAYYKHLGPDLVFEIWWMSFYMENFGIRFCYNIAIFIIATKRIPEFSGYRPRRYPGSQPPPIPKISPRRPEPLNNIETIKVWEEKFKETTTEAEEVAVTPSVKIFVLPASPSYY